MIDCTWNTHCAETIPIVNDGSIPQSLPPLPYMSSPGLTDNQKLAMLEEMIHNASLSRWDYTRQLIDPRKDIYEEAGYPKHIVDPEMYRQQYDRNPIAAQVVECVPTESWQVQPRVYETEDSDDDTPFERDWDRKVGRQLQGPYSWYQDEQGSAVWRLLKHADILSGIGGYGVIFLGLDDGLPPWMPVKGVEEHYSIGSDTLPAHEDSNRDLYGNPIPYGQGQVYNPSSPSWMPRYTRNQRNTNGVNSVNGSKPRPQVPPSTNGTNGHAKTTKAPKNGAKTTTNGKHDTTFPPESREGYQRPSMTHNANPYNGRPFQKYGKYRITVNAKETKGRNLLYARVFPEHLAMVTRFESNPNSPRFGLPIMYLITFNDPRERTGFSGIGLPIATMNVHWTRVIHVADNDHTAGTNPTYAVPRMRPVLNRLIDLDKLYAGSAEGYWRGGCVPGYSLQTNPQLGGDVKVDVRQTKDMMEQYMHGLQKFLLLRGMTAQVLSPQVVDPTPQIDAAIKAICIKLKIPKRIFEGSERGELASGQDDDKWNDMIKARQLYYVTPCIICIFIDRLIMIGVLSEPTQGQESSQKLNKGESAKGYDDERDRDADDDGEPSEFGRKDKVKGNDADERPPTSKNRSEREDKAFATNKATREDNNDDTRDYTDRIAGQEFGVTKKKGKPGDADSTVIETQGGYSIEWPDITSQSLIQKAQVAQTMVATMVAYLQANCAELMAPMDFLTRIMGYDEEEAAAILEAAEEYISQHGPLGGQQGQPGGGEGAVAPGEGGDWNPATDGDGSAVGADMDADTFDNIPGQGKPKGNPQPTPDNTQRNKPFPVGNRANRRTKTPTLNSPRTRPFIAPRDRKFVQSRQRAYTPWEG